jgi:hypothetical protein
MSRQLQDAMPHRTSAFAAFFVLLAACGGPPSATETKSSVADALPSWNDGAPKQAIVSFVNRVTKEGASDFIVPAERIATFDNDGTLWSEQPIYFQIAFVLDRVKELAPKHPEWKKKQPFKSILEGDLKSALAGGPKALAELLAATSGGVTAEESDAMVKTWTNTARHPKTRKLYTEMIYQPMLELMTYLRANNFKTFIISGGGVDFMRPWTEHVYGVPPEQVVGTTMKVSYAAKNGKPELNILPQLDFIDDGPGKPVGIRQFIGRRPIFAAGNSDGDREMLEYTTTGPGPRFAMIVHHTDAEREFAYDRQSAIGKLDKALDQASTANWTVVDMKNDWKVIYPSK